MATDRVPGAAPGAELVAPLPRCPKMSTLLRAMWTISVTTAEGVCTAWRVFERRRRGGVLTAMRAIGHMALGATFLLGVTTAYPEEAAKPTPIKLAVFDFELEDASPTATYQGKIVSSPETLDKVTAAARRELSQSGRYELVDVSKVDAKPATERTLRRCDGCEAGIAQQLGADQSLLGVVIRATATDYYVMIRIRDAHTGKVLVQESANFAGSEEGWPSGVRMLIKHQVLPAQEIPVPETH
jgi:Protein of unknown function (DUF2380)